MVWREACTVMCVACFLRSIPGVKRHVSRSDWLIPSFFCRFSPFGCCWLGPHRPLISFGSRADFAMAPAALGQLWVICYYLVLDRSGAIRVFDMDDEGGSCSRAVVRRRRHYACSMSPLSIQALAPISSFRLEYDNDYSSV
jgi:hypothetical protein